MKYYTDVKSAIGPLIIVKTANDVGYDESVIIEQKDGTVRTGKVLEIRDGLAVVQLFTSNQGLEISTAKVAFRGKGLTIALSPEMLGRMFDGLGNPIDGGEKLLGAKHADINGTAINPVARNYPNNFIQTGISAIDGLNTLVRGQKLPIFSMAGLPHAELAAQIARQATVKTHTKAEIEQTGDVPEKTVAAQTFEKSVSEVTPPEIIKTNSQTAPAEKVTAPAENKFAVVFAAIGISYDEADFFRKSFTETGALSHSVMYLNLASDPALERIATPRMALTCAEYLAFELGYHVLVIMTDMTNYCQALREVSAARKEVPSRRGYPGYMYTDLASLYERAGCIKGRNGSVTQLPILTMPEDDKTHPIPDLTGYITEGQIVLSRELSQKGITPPIDVLPSLSRLKDKGIGENKTRADHSDIMNQLFSAYAKGKDAKELSTILGDAALSDTDKLYCTFADEFENRYINQGFNTNRTIEETLDIGWGLLRILPRAELRRIKEKFLDEYHAN